MTKVGDREIVLREVLLVPESETITFEVPVGEFEPLRVRIAFAEGSSNGPTNSVGSDPRFVIEYETPGKDGVPSLIDLENGAGGGAEISCVIMTFYNFNTPYGQTLQAPQLVADVSGGKEVTFLATVYKFGKIFKIEFQFMIGDSL